MNSNQDANWCVTKPWFDYLLGTRVISLADLQEQNPLGLSLPGPISKKLNRWAEQYFPVKSANASTKDEKYCKKYGSEAVKYAGYGLKQGFVVICQ